MCYNSTLFLNILKLFSPLHSTVWKINSGICDILSYLKFMFSREPKPTKGQAQRADFSDPGCDPHWAFPDFPGSGPWGQMKSLIFDQGLLQRENHLLFPVGLFQIAAPGCYRGVEGHILPRCGRQGKDSGRRRLGLTQNLVSLKVTSCKVSPPKCFYFSRALTKPILPFRQTCRITSTWEKCRKQ